MNDQQRENATQLAAQRLQALKAHLRQTLSPAEQRENGILQGDGDGRPLECQEWDHLITPWDRDYLILLRISPD